MTAFAVLLIAWAFVATPAYAGQLFDVTGVDQSDVLNIRVGIDTVERLQDSAIIGIIPPNVLPLSERDLGVLSVPHRAHRSLISVDKSRDPVVQGPHYKVRKGPKGRTVIG